MSYHNRWITKDDILNDLAEVTGPVGDVDDRFIVKDGKPPLMRRFQEDDDEFNLRFKNNVCQADHVTQAPDLEGITEMLRMMNDTQQEENDFGTITKTDQIVISKLNPDVPEFIPKGPSTSREENSKNSPHKTNSAKFTSGRQVVNNNGNVKNNKSDKTSLNEVINKEICSDNKLKNEKLDCDIDINKRIDVAELDADQIKEITKKLRNKISNANKNNDIQHKREKVVAIATLLKLYSATPRQAKAHKPESGDDGVKPLKLITPEYFESTRVATNELCEIHGVPVNTSIRDTPTTSKDCLDEGISHDSQLPANGNAVNIKTRPDRATPTSSKDSLQEGISQDSQLPANGNAVNIKTSSDRAEVQPTPKLDVGSPIANDCNIADPGVRDSINKVNDWWKKSHSPKPKAPLVCMGPIAFKKKTFTSPKSPVSDAVSRRSTPTNNVAPQIAQYRPSVFADSLSKKFAEQAKTIKKQNMDIWERAQIQMREKEALMKDKSLGQSSANRVEESDSDS